MLPTFLSKRIRPTGAAIVCIAMAFMALAPVYQPVAAQAVSQNLLGQIAFPDATSISNLSPITSNGQAVQFDNGAARLTSANANGDTMFLYKEPATVAANGCTSADIASGNEWRFGILFRALDANNYSWVGFDNATTLRIREVINGASKDIVQTISALPNSFALRIEYWGNDISVYANDNKIYTGARPRANETENNTVVSGNSGIMAWDVHNTAYDNLSVYSFVPSITAVTAEGATVTMEGQSITMLYPYGTDLHAVTPQFTTYPASDVTVTPAGAQDFSSGNPINYTVALKGGGSNTYTLSVTSAPMSVYTNTFEGNNDAAVLESMQNIGDKTNKITHTNGVVVVNANTGNDLYLDTKSPSFKNGSAQVNLTNSDNLWRSGILIRAIDDQNYTWVGIEAQNSLRIRERINGVERDITKAISLGKNSFLLSVHYCDDELLVYADDQLLYNGVRPFKNGDAPLDTPPVSGKVGVMGWDSKNTTFDNLSVKAFSPLVLEATAAAGTGTITDHAIQFAVKEGAALAAFTPTLKAFPSNTVISPTGAQNFSSFEAQTNGIVYTLKAGEGTSSYTVRAASQEGTTHTLSNESLTVKFNTLFPSVRDYAFTSTKEVVFKGSDLSYSDSIFINGKSYSPLVKFSAVDANTVKYDITVKNVSVGNETKTITFVCTYTLAGSDIVLKITEVTGDSETEPLNIAINSPVIAVAGDAENAAITTGGTGGNGGDGGTVAVAGGTMDKSSLSFALLSQKKAAATVYITDQWNRPYTAKIIGEGAAKIGAIYSSGYHHRLADGKKPQKDTSAKATADIPFVQTTHICQDENKDGLIDWQDAALWTRAQMPQMPQAVRSFFNGGLWVQTHAAFPGNGNNGTEAVKSYTGFTTLYSEISQLLEAQRQIYNMTDGVGKTSFEVVGWNGRGHDYGWPSINEIAFNPALGTEQQFRDAQQAIKKYNGDLSFHTNMTDMCDNSNTYLRGSTENEYGNRNSSTGVVQYGNNVFGWVAYKNNHFKDLPYALNRQNAFIGATGTSGKDGRFFAPQFLYSDVMLDYPTGKYTATEEQYAKFRLSDHYKSLGTHLATEYYYSEKRTGGLFLMKNCSYPNTVDQFMNAGQTAFSDTRNVAVQAQDYIWADLYSDVVRDGNANISGAGSGNQLSTQHTELTFLLSYLNGYVAQNKLLRYVEENPVRYTLWENGIKYAANTATGKIEVTKDNIAVANLTLASGKISGDSFIPAYDGTQRIFTYSTAGGEKTWSLLPSITAKSFKLYRLTEKGRVFIKDIPAADQKVTFTVEPHTAYVLDYSNAPVKAISENLSLTSMVTASSNQAKGAWDTYITAAPIPSEALYATKPDKSAWVVGDDPVLKDLSGAMFAPNDATKLRYFRFVISGFAADGVDETYWIPTTADKHWINFAFPGARKITSLKLKHQSSTDNLSATVVGTKADGSTITLFTGKVGKQFAHTLPTPAADIVSVKVSFSDCNNVTVKLCEVEFNS